MSYEISLEAPSLPNKYMGKNVSRDLTPTSHFYIDSATTFQQSLANKFGIVGLGNNSKFKTTATITYTGNVFSICSGFILLQPNSADPTKINLILKPFSQPIKGLSIKYFIYRGLNKDSFLTNDGKILSSGNISEFITLIRNDFNKFYQQQSITVPPFLAEYIGYPSSDPNIPLDQQQKITDLIDDYFFKITEFDNGNEKLKTAYELPIIPRGVNLGSVTGNLGIDIVLDEGDFTLRQDSNPFQLNLGFARLQENILDPDTATTSFGKKLLKESATNFMDIAAFYGLHADTKGKIYINNQNSVKNKDAIYNLIEDFKTSNTFYLYIRSNRQRSYNYYENYKTTLGFNIKVGTDENNLQQESFGTETWPIKVFDINTFSKYYLSLLHNKEYRNNLFFIELGRQSGNNKKNNFVIEEDYINTNSNIQLDYTLPVEFEVSGIASVNMLFYLGSDITFADNTDFRYVHYDYIKELYPVINVKSKLQGSETADFSRISYSKNGAINLRDYSNTQYHSIIQNQLIFYNGKKKDGDNIIEKRKVLLLGKKKDNLDTVSTNDALSVFGSLNSLSINIDDKDDYLKFLIYGDNNFSIYYREAIENGVPIKLLNLKKDGKDDRAFFSLGISETEFEEILNIVPQNVANVTYFLKNVLPNFKADINNVGYYKYSLGVTYEDTQGLKTAVPQNEIYVYGDRLNFLCSKEFSEYEFEMDLDN